MPEEPCEISFYEDGIPPFVGHELDRLYGVRYSSLGHLRVYGKLEKPRTYVRRADNIPVTVILFRIEEHRVSVLNEAIQLPHEELCQFVESVFSRYPQIRTITLPAIQKHTGRLSHPFQAVVYHSDVWLSVPDSAEEYLKGLGRNTRQAIRQELRKLKSSFPTFHCRFTEKEEIREEDIRTVISFNKMKLSTKGIASGDDENEIQRILTLSKECGIACIATIDGRVCGGVIGYRFGENFSFRATGYDPAYESYRIGFLIYFLSVCKCIERNAKHIHLGWGTQDYKFRLGGVQRDLERLILFRSWVHLFLDWKVALQAVFKDKSTKTRRYLKDAATRPGGPLSALAKVLIASTRWLRH